MRGNLPHNEPLKYKQWFETQVYEKMKQNRADCDIWTFHDGPPYANGDIHIGHALNKILKDIVTKYHYFDGKAVRFTPGWDCHGLPIEQKVEEKIGGQKKKELPKSTVRQLCRDHASKYIEIQKEQFKALGVICDWDKPYLTMENHFEANIYKELVAIAKNGLLIQRSKPVYWSWAAKTALAEAEVEYKEKVSPSIYVAFRLKETDDSIIIWTTTPWTLPANSGIALNSEAKYVRTMDGYIVAYELYSSLKADGIVSGDIAGDIDPKELENCYAINPLNDRLSKIVLGSHVETSSGTGCVHTAPGHGEDDYVLGLQNDLAMLMPVADNGCFDETLVKEKLLPQEFVGVNIFKANDGILELLGDSLLKRVDITHSYPFCWRTHKPVIYRATKQWFIALDKPYGKDGKTLRDNALDAIDKVNFYPKSGKNRLLSMIQNRPDWCISRQRDWGVPIAFFVDKTTKEPVMDEKVLDHIAGIFETHGADAWWDMSVEELLYAHSGLDPKNLTKTTDILDVWFDSGSTQKAVLRSKQYDAGNYPADMYLEGSDQHRGWFQSSLLVSLSSNQQIPYKSILTHGFTVDAKGEKMSKSKGNVVAPDKVIKQYGTEILRLWVAMSDFQNDLKISDEILKQMAEQYRKIRNTLRFLLSNISDLETLSPVDELGQIDKWILAKTKKVYDDIDKDFATYEFSKGINKLNNYLVADLSNIYLDVCKDKLYCDKKRSKSRTNSQTVMLMITKATMQLLAPILTYTMDEILGHTDEILDSGVKSLFDIEKYELPQVDCSIDESYMLEAKNSFNETIESLKKEKVIKSTLELVIYSKSPQLDILSPAEAEDWFVVSKVIHHKEDKVVADFTVGGDKFEIYFASKQKCERCWKYRAKETGGICHRCQDVVDSL